MKRRALLAALGTGLCGIAGCVGAPPGSDGETTDDGGWTTRPRKTTATPTETTTTAATPNPANVTMTASPESAELPKATVEFTLRNDTNTTFASNFYGWNLDKRAEGEWVHVSPRAIPVPLHLMKPGGEHTWTLSIDNTVPVTDDGWTNTDAMKKIAYSGFGPGTYRFRISGWLEDDGESSSERTYAATVELTGDPIELRPEPSVETRREGETLVVETEDYDPSRQSIGVTVTPAPDHDGETEHLITELAYRYPGLRNTLPYFEREGVEHVKLLTEDAGFVVPRANSHVEYEGTVYRLEAKEIEKETETETTSA